MACSAALEDKSMLYLHMMQEKKMADTAYNTVTGDALWAASLQLVAKLKKEAKTTGH